MENQPKTPCPPREEIFRHYGYPEDTPDKGIAVGNWEKDDAFERLAFLPELIDVLHFVSLLSFLPYSDKIEGGRGKAPGSPLLICGAEWRS